EGARGDAAVQHFGLVRGILIGDFFALDRQRVLFRDDGELFLGEAGNGDRDAIGIIAGPLDVVGGIAGAAVGGRLVEQGEKTVEADGGTIKRSKIVGTHV